MPRIKPYESQVGSGGNLPTRQSSGQDFGGAGLSNLGQGLENLGQSAGQAQRIINADNARMRDDIQRQKVEASHIAVQKVLSDSQLASIQAEDERRKRARPDALGHLDEAVEFGKLQSDDVINKITEDPNSAILPEHYDKVRLGIAQNANHITLEASRFAAESNAKHQVSEIAETVSTWQNVIQANPSMLAPTLGRLQQLDEGITGINESVKKTMISGFRQSLFGSAIDGRVDAVAKLHDVDSIQVLRKHLENPDSFWQKEVDPKVYAHALDRLTVLEASEKEQRDILAAASRKELRDEAATGVNNGFDPVKSSAYEKDPAKRALLEKDGRAAVRTGQAVRDMQHGSFIEQAQALSNGEAALSSPGNFHQDVETQQARVAVFSNRMQAIKNDLASEVMKSPAVQQAAKEADPSIPGSMDRYVRANTAEAERIAPWREPVLLTKAQVGDIKAKLSYSDATPQGADVALRLIGGEREKWGAHWPTVLRQLTQEDALSGDQAVAARMAQSPTKEPDARLLLVTGMMKPDDMDKLPGIPPGTRKDMRENIQELLDPVRQAMVRQVGGAKELARYQQASEVLAMGYMLRGETNPKRAAELATQSIVTNDFHWAGDFAVPLRYDPDIVKRGAKNAQQQVPENIAVPFDLRGLRDGDITAAMNDHLQNKARWTMNQKGDGLVLTWDTASGEQVLLKQSDGSLVPYEVSYDQLNTLGVGGKQRPVAPAQTKVPNAF